MTFADEWEGSEEELVSIAEESIFNYSYDNGIDEADEILVKLYLEALSHSDIQAAIHEKMAKIHHKYRIKSSPRLTKRGEDGTAFYIKCFDGSPCEGAGCENKECKMMDIVCEKLAAYEDAEEDKCYVRS